MPIRRKGPAVRYEVNTQLTTTVSNADTGDRIASFTTVGTNDKHDSHDGTASAVAPALAEALAVHSRITAAIDGVPTDE